MDTRKWDYKHQVLATNKVPPWRVILWVKAMEVIMQARPKAVMRLLTGRDPAFLHAMRWYTSMGRRVWFHEIGEYLFGTRQEKNGPSVGEFWGRSLHAHEEALAKKKKKVFPINIKASS
jgi:anaerobic magnesium-protoporphyrin IX monomethyl ester cyclase